MVHEFLMQQTKVYLLQLNKPFSKEKAQKYFADTYLSRFNEIISEVKNDAKNADILNGVQHGKIDFLTKISAETSLKYGCLKYAEETINNSQN